MVPSYDPETNLIFVGTSVTIPAPKFILAGNDKTYLYHNSTLALNADTGKIVWHYQHVVDHWDHDHPLRAAAGRDRGRRPIRRKSRGSIRGSSRASGARWSPAFPARPASSTRSTARTGEFLWARPTIMQNVIKGIDGATGAVTVNPDALVHEARRDAR